MTPLSTVLCAAFILASSAATARAAEIKMIASNAVKEAYSELLSQFEAASGHKVTVDWGGTADITRRIANGEVADIVIIPAANIDALIGQGRLAAGSRADVVKSTIGVAVRRGVSRPDVSSAAALKSSLLAAKSIVISSGPSGVYLTGLFDRMGIAGEIKAKLTQIAPGEGVGEAILQGKGDIGFTQVSEFLHVNGIDYIGPLSADVQQVTTFSSGLHANAPSRDAAKALVEFVTSPAVAPVLEKHGLQPG